jgi:hypothetical protein
MPSKKSKKKPVEEGAPIEGVGLTFQLSEDWRATWDGIQFCVQRRVVATKGNNIGGESWVTVAWCREIGSMIYYLASRRIYGIAGAYGVEAIEPLCTTLEAIRADARAMVKKVLADLPAKDIWEPLP